ncbi:MAG: tRNA glutamyl-Q(34) synthetase GluQRS [Eggerthellaceae bacterium]|nr:tRNA glutamyl-Q(34) synthetase GluQRS [Eggerthellaceae bacterium]
MQSQESNQIVVRFAPSPSGRMHAGNIASALITWLFARLSNGKVILRIEDLDRSRSKQEHIDNILLDFEKLGLTWDEGPYFQSSNQEAYSEALEVLRESAHIYPCFCTRADLAAARAPHEGEYAIYPGTCRHLSEEQISTASARRNPSYRIEVPSETIFFDDILQGSQGFTLDAQCGDAILRRSDGGFSYQLAVSVDDALQGISLVSRGYDLLASTPLQMYLLKLLGYEAPNYAHIPLLVSQEGIRLSKRNKDASIDQMLVSYHSFDGIIGHIAYLYGLSDADRPISPDGLSKLHNIETLINSLWKQDKIIWRP